MNTRFQRGLAVFSALLLIVAAVAAVWYIDDRLVNGTDSEWIDNDDDGLSDTFEEMVSKTDPHNPDSDSTKTARDEGNNGVNDSKERLGDTRLSLFVQQRIGANPFANDTDGDGLTDTFELVDLGLINNTVNATDTDGDGIPDGNEDPDNDTLTNHREQDLGTDPLDDDTDSDGSTDDYEVAHDLDPLTADSDTDGIDDGGERTVGTDPTVSDTNGDGTPDGNETHTVATANETLGVSLTVTGDGDPTQSLSMEKNRTVAFNNISSSVSPVVELDTNRSFSRARVTIAYNDSRVSRANESDLSIYTFNESQGTFVKLNSTVNAGNNTVTATTTHFSTFVVFKVRNWNAQFDTPLPTRGAGSGDESVEFVDAQFIIDSSPSMAENDPNGYRKIAAKRFVDALIKGDKASLVTFGGYPVVKQGFTTDLTAVKTDIDQLGTITSTDIGYGLREGLDTFERSSDPSHAKVIVLLTDGRNTVGSDSETLAQARRAAAQNITIYTIGFGASDNALLRRIADITGGEFHHVENVDELPQVFSRVANKSTMGKDSDGDGIPNTVETGGIRSGTGKVYHTKPNDPDSDDDDIPDGVEVGERIRDRYYTIISNPEIPDSDSDSISDAEEYRQGTNPLNSDTDVSGGGSKLKKARAILSGAIFGETGIKGGAAHGIVGELASSAYYLVGWIGFSIIPVAGALGDIRDAVQAFIKGELLSGAFSIAGIIPVAGDAAKMVSIIRKFIGSIKATGGKVTSKIKKVASRIAKTFLRFKNVKYSIKLKALDIFTKKKASMLEQQGIPVNDIVKYVIKRVNLNQVSNLRQAGIPAADISTYVTRGFDLGRMSEAFDLYRNYKRGGGRDLFNMNLDNARGVLGEILARKYLERVYSPSDYEFVSGITLDGSTGRIGEIDWTVVDKHTGDVVAIYEVKASESKLTKAQDQLKNIKGNFSSGKINKIKKKFGVTVNQFTRNAQNIDYNTMGPRNANGFNTAFDLTQTEFEALLDTIRKIERSGGVNNIDSFEKRSESLIRLQSTISATKLSSKRSQSKIA